MVYGTQISGWIGSCKPRFLTSATTPMISNHASGNLSGRVSSWAMCTRCPSGFSLARYLCTKVWFDDCQLALAFHLRLGEGPPVDKLDFQCREITFTAQLENRVPFLRVRFAWDIDVARNSTIRRQGARFCGIQNAGQDCKPPQQRSIKAGNLI